MRLIRWVAVGLGVTWQVTCLGHYNNFLNQSALVLLGEEVLHVIEPSPIKQKCLSTSLLKDYLQDAGAWFIREINYVLDRLDFEKQIVRMIPKAENNSEHKNQSNTTSNTVRVIKAIKAMRSSDMASNTIRMNPGVIKLLVALRQKPETGVKAWCSGSW